MYGTFRLQGKNSLMMFLERPQICLDLETTAVNQSFRLLLLYFKIVQAILIFLSFSCLCSKLVPNVTTYVINCYVIWSQFPFPNILKASTFNIFQKLVRNQRDKLSKKVKKNIFSSFNTRFRFFQKYNTFCHRDELNNYFSQIKVLHNSIKHSKIVPFCCSIAFG